MSERRGGHRGGRGGHRGGGGHWKGKGHRGEKKDFGHSLQKDQELTGILVTCSGTNEKAAVKDIYRILNMYAERSVPNFIDDVDWVEVQREGQGKMLQKRAPEVGKGEKSEQEGGVGQKGEVSEKEGKEGLNEGLGGEKSEVDGVGGEKEKKNGGEKKEKRLKHFQQMRMKAKGMIFIIMNKSITDQISPQKLTKAILDGIEEDKTLLTKFCSRIYPIEYTVDASIENYEKYATLLVAKYFPELPEGTTKTWCIHFKCRSNNKFTKNQFMSVLLRLIPPCYHFLQYKAEIEFFVDITHHTMCLTVLSPYSEHKYYSFQKMIDQRPKDSGKNQSGGNSPEQDKGPEEEDSQSQSLGPDSSDASDIKLF